MSDTALRALLTLAVLGLLVAAVWAMWRGWRGRAETQADVPTPSDAPLPGTSTAPAVAPEGAGDVRLGPMPGRWVATTTHGSWLDRVVVHGLGTPSRATVTVRTDGVLVERVGARDVFVPRADVVGARLDRGIAGAVYEDGGLVVLEWHLGDRVLDTGFRSDHPDTHQELVAAVSALESGQPTATEGAA